MWYFLLHAILSRLDRSDNIGRKIVLIPHSMVVLTSSFLSEVRLSCDLLKAGGLRLALSQVRI